MFHQVPLSKQQLLINFVGLNHAALCWTLICNKCMASKHFSLLFLQHHQESIVSSI